MVVGRSFPLAPKLQEKVGIHLPFRCPSEAAAPVLVLITAEHDLRLREVTFSLKGVKSRPVKCVRQEEADGVGGVRARRPGFSPGAGAC